MKRLYYLINTVDDAEQMSDTLHQAGISDWHFHVLGQENKDAELEVHHVQSASPLHRLDIIHSGEQGLIIGFLCGALIATLIVSVSTQLGLTPWVLVVCGFSLFGAWAGGLIGATKPNYQLKRFRGLLQQGKFVALIDTAKTQEARIKQLLNHLSYATPVGEQHLFIWPFNSNDFQQKKTTV